MFKVGDKVVRTKINGFWAELTGSQYKNYDDIFTVKSLNGNRNILLEELKGSFNIEHFKLVKPKDTIIMRNIIKYQVLDTQLNKVVNTFDTLKDAEDTLYRLNKNAINIGEEFENGNIAVKVENVDLVSEEVEVVIYHCGQPFYSSYDLSKFLREFKKCVQ